MVVHVKNMRRYDPEADVTKSQDKEEILPQIESGQLDSAPVDVDDNSFPRRLRPRPTAGDKIASPVRELVGPDIRSLPVGSASSPLAPPPPPLAPPPPLPAPLPLPAISDSIPLNRDQSVAIPQSPQRGSKRNRDSSSNSGFESRKNIKRM